MIDDVPDGSTKPRPRLSTVQQERSRITRQNLMQAAERLWRTKGFDETTVSDVCEEAGVAKGTFYFYFPHKEDLLLELSASTMDAVAASATIALDDDLPTTDVLRVVVAAIAKRVGRTPKELLARTLSEVSRHVDPRLVDHWAEFKGERPDFRTIFEAIFRHAQRRGELPRDYLPAELAAVLAAAVNNGLLGWALNRVGGAALETVLWRRVVLVLNGARAGFSDPD